MEGGVTEIEDGGEEETARSVTGKEKGKGNRKRRKRK